MNTPDATSEPDPAPTPTLGQSAEEALTLARARATELYRRLHAEIDASGLGGPAWGFYVRRGLLVYALYAAGYALLLLDPNGLQHALGIGLVAFATVQGGFLAHDAGHEAISRRKGWNRTFGLLFLTLTGGQLFSHWVHNHNRHHAHPNDEIRDPELQGGPFALHLRDALRKRGLSRLLTANQHWLLWPVLTLLPFAMKKDTFVFLAKNPRSSRLDVAVMVGHYALWLLPPALGLGLATALVNYLLMSWSIGLYLIAVFLINRSCPRGVGPTERLPYLDQAVLSARNLPGGWWISFLCGGLNHQIEHHLLPRTPACRLGRIRAIARPLLLEHGLPYREQGWWSATRDLQRHLAMVASAARAPRIKIGLEG